MLLLLIPVALAAIFAVALLVTRSGRGSLDRVPGYDTSFPDGVMIVIHKTAGLFGASNQEDRVYGTAADDGTIVASFDEALGRAGYHVVPTSTPAGSEDKFLRKYEQGGVTWTLIVRPLPQRINGHTYDVGEQGFTRSLVVRLES